MRAYINETNFITEVSLNNALHVQIHVLGLNGSILKSVDCGMKPAGTHTFEIRHDDLASGVYFINCVFNKGGFSNAGFERKQVIVAK